MAAPKPTVTVRGSSCYPWILVESNKTIKSKFTSMISVQAPALVHRSNAASIHLVVVLDVWRSQEGLAAGARRLDLVKTMEFINGEFLERDPAAKDRVEVVDACAFNNDNGVAISRSIDKWISGGAKATDYQRYDLRTVLEGAVKILDEGKQQTSGDVKRVGFIILLSDGLSKLTFDESIDDFLGKYPVHTLDLCCNHDPEMLHSVAQRSRGTYSTVAAAADDLNNNKLLEGVAVCLGGLKSVVAINTRARINVSLNGTNPGSNIDKDGIRIKIQPGNQDISGNKEGFLVDDGILYAGEEKELIVEINFSTNGIGSRTRSATLTATVEYEDGSHKQVVPPPCKVPLLVTGTTNGPARNAYELLLPNPIVLQRMIMPEVLEMVLSSAKTIKEVNMTAAKAAGKLLSSLDELVEKVAQKMKVKMSDLSGIDCDIKQMAECLKTEGVSSGLRSMYSWVSSNQTQRATTNMGLKTRFRTQEMGAMVEKARDKNKQQLVAQKKTPPPPSPPVEKDAVKMGKQKDNTVPAQTSTATLDDKSKRAINKLKECIQGTATLDGNSKRAINKLIECMEGLLLAGYRPPPPGPGPGPQPEPTAGSSSRTPNKTSKTGQKTTSGSAASS